MHLLNIKNLLIKKKGIFYDEITFEKVDEFVSFSIEKNNLLVANNSFKFEYFIQKIDLNQSFKLKNFGKIFFISFFFSNQTN